MTDQPRASRDTVLIDLALQGGGSHGAFTWGVLDRLLEAPWLKIEAISGTSAGAMNAAVLVSGHMKGGADGARTSPRSRREKPKCGGVTCSRWSARRRRCRRARRSRPRRRRGR